ncbi:MAG: DNA repair protein RadA [Sphingomonadales bacterium]
MVKAAVRYVCQSCGEVYAKWQGQCTSCNEWNSISQEAEVTGGHKSAVGARSPKTNVVTLSTLADETENAPRFTTGVAELDRTLGGGLVRGSATLIGGDPGIGKSTLLLQAAAKLSLSGKRVVYISGEEAVGQVRLRGQRMGLSDAPLALGAATNLNDILATIDTGPAPDVVIIDSIQTMFADEIDAAPGTVSQVRASAQALIRFAKARSTALFLVGHVTKDGQIAGPRVLEHMVDTVLYFEGERGHQFRILRGVKNRFGPTDEIGVFEMTGGGLNEVANPSALFLSEREADVPGTCVFAGLEGTRPLLVEIQALVSPTPAANPRRTVVGWDSGRLAMVLAVLDARAGLGFGNHDVYLNIAGGLKIGEPAADLAVGVALLSSLTDTAIPRATIAFGEIALSGEVHGVPQPGLRLKEAAKLGFEASLIPGGKSSGAPCTLTQNQIGHVTGLLDALGLSL